MASTSSSTPGPAYPVSKRRKTRKGTFSCWECKHRKRRCKFEPPSSPICVYCQSHGSPCISQEHADPRSGSEANIQHRMVHVEALVSQLIQQRNRSCQPHPSQELIPAQHCRPAPHERIESDIQGLLSAVTDGPDLTNRFQQLSGSLRALLPHPHVAVLILSKGGFFSLPFQTLIPSRKRPSSTIANVEHPETDPGLPITASHPIHLARKLIQLALGLQQLQFTPSDHPELQLKDSTTETSRRYLELASCHVTSQDILIDSVDGLDTLLLEARYHINSGNLRAAWLIFRRALSIAETIGLSQRNEKASSRAKFVWSQLVFNDRFLSLMLGLPVAVNNPGFSSEQTLDTYPPFRKLDRLHCVIAGRIIARNMRMRRCDLPGQETLENAYDDYAVTRDIDSELKKVARSVPVGCWEIPTTEDALLDTDKMDRISRLFTQMHQYYLLVVLHQPYILRHRGHHVDVATASSQRPDYAYSKQAVPPACREVLTRCLAFRNIRPVLSYRGLQHKAFTAAVALVLSHIEGHRLGASNVLEHQRPHDLGIVRKVIQTLDELCCSSNPNRYIAIETSTQLNKLMSIEAEAANGIGYVVYIEEEGTGTGSTRSAVEPALKLPMPYFGSICITRG
ncbi:hypothetical protein BO70DRAFT_265762, partial [Aspergillus heteromorphus CBS 117.55]